MFLNEKYFFFALIALLLPVNTFAQGHLFIRGGGAFPDYMRSRFIELAGGSNAKIVIIPYAGTDGLSTAIIYEKLGINADFVVGKPDLPENLKKLDGATGIMFTGGQQSRLAGVLLGTVFLERIKEFYRNGGLVGGNSAGAAVMSEVMIVRGDGKADGAKISRGFGFIDFAIIDQHFSERERQPRLIRAAKEYNLAGIGIDEGTGVYFNGVTRTFEVMGDASVIVYEHKSTGIDTLTFYSGDRFTAVSLSNGRIGFRKEPALPSSKLHDQIKRYAAAGRDVEITADQSFTLTMPLDIPKPETPGARLTIRSANPSAPVTITRGTTGNLFTVPDGVTLVLENIVIDGDRQGKFAGSSGGSSALVRVDKGGTLIMNKGAVVRNNINPKWGGGVYMADGAAFTMNGGELSGNVSGDGGGGVHVTRAGAFTMTNGKISGNTTGTMGGGVNAQGTFTMTGGSITGNTAAKNGSAVRRGDAGTVNLFGGVIAGPGRTVADVVNGAHNLNTGAPPAPNDAKIEIHEITPHQASSEVRGGSRVDIASAPTPAPPPPVVRIPSAPSAPKPTAVDPSSVVRSTFTDSRDGKTYRTVKIGNQTWMAENLNYQTDNSRCYRKTSFALPDDSSNCEKYGRLYEWNAAMEACPAGWRLPADSDWNDLLEVIDESIDERIAGRKLKSKTGWNDNGNGTDDYGFSALPGGRNKCDKGSATCYDNIGRFGYWWSATEAAEHSVYRARFRSIYYDYDRVLNSDKNKEYRFSVRCLQQERP